MTPPPLSDYTFCLSTSLVRTVWSVNTWANIPAWLTVSWFYHSQYWLLLVRPIISTVDKVDIQILQIKYTIPLIGTLIYTSRDSSPLDFRRSINIFTLITVPLSGTMLSKGMKLKIGLDAAIHLLPNQYPYKIYDHNPSLRPVSLKRSLSTTPTKDPAKRKWALQFTSTFISLRNTCRDC